MEYPSFRIGDLTIRKPLIQGGMGVGGPPLALLDELQRIENEQGRVRLRRWGERTLDLDILLYGDQIIQNERLTVPHYDMKNREFVIVPLYDIAQDLVLPEG